MTIENMLKEILSNPYIVPLAIGEAGFYVMKYMGYNWIRSSIETESLNDNQTKRKLRIVRNSFLLPTPLDLIVAMYSANRYKSQGGK